MTEELAKKEFKPIVIKELFMDKNPGLARLIPGFIYRMLRRALELDFTNEILQTHGEKNLPSGGNNIFVSNHPLGGFDGVMLISELGKRYKPIEWAEKVKRHCYGLPEDINRTFTVE